MTSISKFIENSNYDLTFFHNLAKKYQNKEIEILSNDLNSKFDKNLGKEMMRISKMLLVDKEKDIKKIMKGGNLAVPLTISCVACTMLGIIYVMREGAGFPILACAAICRAAMAV